MKRTLKAFLIIMLLLGGVVAFFFVMMGGPSWMARHHRFEKFVKTGDHAAIAQAAIAVIQQTGAARTYYSSDNRTFKVTSLPQAISDMRPSYVYVEPTGMSIEFCGGFDHFGFNIRKDEDEWELSWYTEHKKQRLLGLPLEKTNTANLASGNADRKIDPSSPQR